MAELIRVSADQWYRVRRLDNDITWIDEPHIRQFYRCNIWHIRGRDRDLLVDSGMGVVSLRTHVPLVTEKTCLAVASHSHFDHIGCHHEFEHRAIHRAEADILANANRKNSFAEGCVCDDIFTALPPAPYLSASYAPKAAPATQFLADGEIIDLGDRQLEVIHTPGHSPGGIALFEKATGTLFSGDIVYDGPLVEDMPHSNAEDYEKSMLRLLDLDLSVVHGGHFNSYSGERHKQLISDWLNTKDASK